MVDLKPPSTYLEWLKMLDLLKMRENDRAVQKAIQTGSLEWQIGVADKFSEKLAETINFRIKEAVSKFQKEISYAKGQESLIVHALLGIRKEIIFLVELIGTIAIPDEIREEYCRLIKNQADKMQESLEKSTKWDRTGKTLRIVRNNRINGF